MRWQPSRRMHNIQVPHTYNQHIVSVHEVYDVHYYHDYLLLYKSGLDISIRVPSTLMVSVVHWCQNLWSTYLGRYWVGSTYQSTLLENLGEAKFEILWWRIEFTILYKAHQFRPINVPRFCFVLVRLKIP